MTIFSVFILMVLFKSHWVVMDTFQIQDNCWKAAEKQALDYGLIATCEKAYKRFPIPKGATHD